MVVPTNNDHHAKITETRLSALTGDNTNIRSPHKHAGCDDQENNVIFLELWSRSGGGSNQNVFSFRMKTETEFGGRTVSL